MFICRLCFSFSVEGEEEEEEEDEEEPGDSEAKVQAKEPPSSFSCSSEVGSVTHQRSYQCKTPCPKKDTDAKEEEEEEDEEEEEEEEEDGGKSPPRDEVASEAAAAATSRASSRASSVAAGVVLKEMEEMSGAETASEIFRHLQATTKDKTEVTTELAKILSVLETTLSKSKEGIRRGTYMQQLTFQRSKKTASHYPLRFRRVRREFLRDGRRGGRQENPGEGGGRKEASAAPWREGRDCCGGGGGGSGIAQVVLRRRQVHLHQEEVGRRDEHPVKNPGEKNSFAS